MEKGKLYIVSFKLRKEHIKLPINTLKINVTSAQKKNSKYRIAFSPMTPIENLYKDFICFENYWQSGKVYENIDNLKNINWWKKQEKGKKRNPATKNKKILYSIYPNINKKLNYIESRKRVYIPEYYNLIKNNKIILELKEKLLHGENISIYDLDGPKLDNGECTYNLVTLDIIKEKINDERFPLGHGYIICALLLNLILEDII